MTLLLPFRFSITFINFQSIPDFIRIFSWSNLWKIIQNLLTSTYHQPFPTYIYSDKFHTDLKNLHILTLTLQCQTFFHSLCWVSGNIQSFFRFFHQCLLNETLKTVEACYQRYLKNYKNCSPSINFDSIYITYASKDLKKMCMSGSMEKNWQKMPNAKWQENLLLSHSLSCKTERTRFRREADRHFLNFSCDHIFDTAYTHFTLKWTVWALN